MLQKAARLKATIVVSRTSPSSLSIQLAQRWGITLIGYARRTSFRIYTHPERIDIAAIGSSNLTTDLSLVNDMFENTS
jgi:FdhD protein